MAHISGTTRVTGKYDLSNCIYMKRNSISVKKFKFKSILLKCVGKYHYHIRIHIIIKVPGPHGLITHYSCSFVFNTGR